MPEEVGIVMKLHDQVSPILKSIRVFDKRPHIRNSDPRRQKPGGRSRRAEAQISEKMRFLGAQTSSSLWMRWRETAL